jgi:hypothetical protein
VNVVVCVAIGLDHGFPGRRFGVALGIRGLEYKRRDLPAQQSARLVANRPRGREIEATEIAKREIAALEHEFGVALAALDGADAIEHRIQAGLVG